MKRICHTGCGPIIIRQPNAEWLNIDIEPSHNPDMVLDYTKDLVFTFGYNAFDAYYSCHSLEHCSLPDGISLALTQAHTVLKPGGVIRIVVPNLMKVALKYVAGESLKDIYQGPFHEGPDFPATRFMYFCRAWEHTVLFDFDLLKHFLEKAGFQYVIERPFNESMMPELCGHDRFRSESLILEAIK